MFLTGFDATTLNTLWVDKNLRMHGLVQAFSRTNRILNSVKTFGNIVCFRDLEKRTNEAIGLFGNKEAHGIVLLKSYTDYFYGYLNEKGERVPGYEERIAELLQKYPLGDTIIGEQNKKEFVVLFGNVLRLRNILTCFDDFADNALLSPRDFQDYTGIYHDIHEEFKHRVDKDSILDDVIFEMELVKQVEVNIDYIIDFVEQYVENYCKDKEILVSIDRAIRSSLELRSKKALIEEFIAHINHHSDVRGEWHDFVEEQKEKDISELIAGEHLQEEKTRKFFANALRDGVLKTTGTDIDTLLPPTSRFSAAADRTAKKKSITAKLLALFNKYFGIARTVN